MKHLMLPCSYPQRAGLLKDLITSYGAGGRTIIFTDSKKEAAELSVVLGDSLGAQVGREGGGSAGFCPRPIRVREQAAERPGDPQGLTVAPAMQKGKPRCTSCARVSGFRMRKALASNLLPCSFPCSAQALHGDLAQSMREQTLDGFRKGRFAILIATDVAARGLDVTGIELVLMVDPPADWETYIHRSGRTGRAGSSGVCVTLVTKKMEYMVGGGAGRAGAGWGGMCWADRPKQQSGKGKGAAGGGTTHGPTV